MASELIPHSRPIVTRAEARASGLTHYFTGKPCKRGHISERHSSGRCIACGRVFMARWREQHPGCFQEWASQNREARNAYMRNWTALHRSRLVVERKARRAKNPLPFMLDAARSRAKLGGTEFNLTKADFPHLPTKCPVLGIDIVYGAPKQSAGSPSIDRIDNKKGYVSGNVLIVSWRANNLKADASIEELAAIVRFYSRLQDPKGGV